MRKYFLVVPHVACVLVGQQNRVAWPVEGGQIVVEGQLEAAGTRTNLVGVVRNETNIRWDYLRLEFRCAQSVFNIEPPAFFPKQEIQLRHTVQAAAGVELATCKMTGTAVKAETALMDTRKGLILTGSSTIFVADDKPCLADFLTAMKTDGIRRRKQIHELLTYGCGILTPAGTLVQTVATEETVVRVRLLEGEHKGYAGFVLVDWIGRN